MIGLSISFGLPLGFSLRKAQIETPPVKGHMQPFTLADENGYAFSDKRLGGAVALFHFIDTECIEECQGAFDTLRRLSKALKGAGPTTWLVSLTVHPETDTSQRLLGYRRVNSRSFMYWHLLTGTREDVNAFILDNMKLATMDPRLKDLTPQTFDRLAKEGWMVLIDQAGQIRSVHRPDTDAEMNTLVKDIAVVINTNPPSPAASADKPAAPVEPTK